MNYQRILSYLYDYDRGVKCKNIGFVKVETRGDLCRVNIHMKAPELLSVETLRGYFFLRRNDEILGIPFTDEKPVGSECDVRAMLPAAFFEACGFWPDDFAGVYICQENRKNLVFVSAWDDEPVYVETFRELEPAEKRVKEEKSGKETGKDFEKEKRVRTDTGIEKEKETEAERKTGSGKETETGTAKEKETDAERKTGTGKEIETGTGMGKEEESDAERKTGSGKETETGSAKEIETDAERKTGSGKETENGMEKESETEKKTGIEEEKRTREAEIEKETDLKTGTGIRKENYTEKQAENGKMIDLEAESEIENEAEKETGNKTGNKTENEMENDTENEAENVPEIVPSGINPDVAVYGNGSTEGKPAKDGTREDETELHDQTRSPWEELAKNFTKFLVRDDNASVECLKIRPHHLALLPRRYWNDTNSSFLLHGYYTYGHLILARRDSEEKYFLGIPGKNRDRDRVMAAYYGYTMYLSTGRKNHNFGYWCREVTLQEQE